MSALPATDILKVPSGPRLADRGFAPAQLAVTGELCLPLSSLRLYLERAHQPRGQLTSQGPIPGQLRLPTSQPTTSRGTAFFLLLLLLQILSTTFLHLKLQVSSLAK